MKEESIETTGVIQKRFGKDYEVKLDNGHICRCFLSGKMYKHKIHVYAGDRILISFSPYSLEIGRVTRRL
jgi:translation initiation factor IF-1